MGLGKGPSLGDPCMIPHNRHRKGIPKIQKAQKPPPPPPDQANGLLDPDGKLDYKEFYNDAVNSMVDMKQDYRRWHDVKRRGCARPGHLFLAANRRCVEVLGRG